MFRTTFKCRLLYCYSAKCMYCNITAFIYIPTTKRKKESYIVRKVFPLFIIIINIGIPEAAPANRLPTRICPYITVIMSKFSSSTKTRVLSGKSMKMEYMYISRVCASIYTNFLKYIES